MFDVRRGEPVQLGRFEGVVRPSTGETALLIDGEWEFFDDEEAAWDHIDQREAEDE